MPSHDFHFANSRLPFVAGMLASHANPVTCLLWGKDRPLVVRGGAERTEADMVLIRPGVEHSVEIGGNAVVLYFDGLAFPNDAPVAARLQAGLASLANDALEGDLDALDELRLQLERSETRCPRPVAAIIDDIVGDPMTRMTQTELAARLGLERTRAQRYFKSVTGMTFRAFKSWTGLRLAATRIADGELIRTAAMDAGFSDSAHLTRTFRHSFGTTPSQATQPRR